MSTQLLSNNPRENFLGTFLRFLLSISMDNRTIAYFSSHLGIAHITHSSLDTDLLMTENGKMFSDVNVWNQIVRASHHWSTHNTLTVNMSTWHYFNVNQNMHLIVLLCVLCAMVRCKMGCCWASLGLLCQTETQTPAVQWPVVPSSVLPSMQWCNVFYSNINVHLPKCLNRHHNDNENVLSIVYCVEHTYTFTVSKKSRNNVRSYFSVRYAA